MVLSLNIWYIFEVLLGDTISHLQMLVICAYIVTFELFPLLLSYAVGTVPGRGMLLCSASLEGRRSVHQLKRSSPANWTATASTIHTTSLVRLTLHSILDRILKRFVFYLCFSEKITWQIGVPVSWVIEQHVDMVSKRACWTVYVVTANLLT